MLKIYNLVAKKCDNNVIVCEMAAYSKNRPLNKDLLIFLKRLKEMANYAEFQ
jgi:hypothetical protein